VAPLNFLSGHGLLRCPVCRRDLAPAPGSLVCHNGHRFDLAREGYVNLLRGARRQPAAGGDSSAQLEQRRAFLGAGHFEAITSVIAEQVQHQRMMPECDCWHVLDGGFGTGHHLARMEAVLSSPVVGLGLDISKHASRHAARRWPKLAFAVADLWAEWPVKDAAIDLVLSVFAPRNFPETARVLRHGGWIAVAYPGPEHLRELRQRFNLLDQHGRKSERIIAAVNRLIGPTTFVRYHREVILDEEAIRAVIMMGPNARYIESSTLTAGLGSLAVTFDVSILLARHTANTGADRPMAVQNS
jgi:23S rRNA (guanine745-N1)-methyltransferase